jgi:hypothetical protein
LTLVTGLLAASGWSATNPAPPTAAGLPDEVAVAQGTSENRSLALSLLKKHAETMARLRSFICVEESSIESQSLPAGQSGARANANRRLLMRDEYRTDGNRYSIRMRSWGNIGSAGAFIPEDRCPSNRELWDGKTYFSYAGTAYTPATGIARYGTLYLVTQWNEAQAREKMRLPRLWRLFEWSGLPPVDPLMASSLSVRTNLQPLDQAQCYVIEIVTATSDNTATPAVQFTVQGALWLDPERGYAAVHATRQDQYTQGSRRWSASGSLERVVCKEFGGIWLPIEGWRRDSHGAPDGDHSNGVEQYKVTGVTLNPDHQALRSFVPGDIKNGALVRLNPVPHQPYDAKQLPVWQDGRVVDKQGREVFDSGLRNTNTSRTNPAAKE